MAEVVKAIAAARSSGKGLWFPQGRFIHSGHPELNEAHVPGAGMWYTELHGINGNGGFIGRGDNM